MNKETAILVFARIPEIGKVKTRIAEKTGRDSALLLYTSLLTDLFENLSTLLNQCTIFLEGTGEKNQFRELFNINCNFKKQNGKDLGEKMKNAFAATFFEGAEKVVLIGSDIPGINHVVVRQAMELLSKNDAVIGPAEDGGYYLIGLKKKAFYKELFEDIEWGTDSVLRKTLEKADYLGLKVYLLDKKRDLDTVDDLINFRNNPAKLEGWDTTMKIINSLLSGRM